MAVENQRTTAATDANDETSLGNNGADQTIIRPRRPPVISNVSTTSRIAVDTSRFAKIRPSEVSGLISPITILPFQFSRTLGSPRSISLLAVRLFVLLTGNRSPSPHL